MRKGLAALVAVATFAAAVSGCSKSEPAPVPLSNDQQVTQFVTTLDVPFAIDTVKKADGSTVTNAHWEVEKQSKTRKTRVLDKRTGKLETKMITINSGAIIAEVTVVVAGNCKAQIEQILNVGSTSYYFDETWLQNGKEVDASAHPDSFMPTIKSLEDYLRDSARVQQFAYCLDKPFAHSPPDRD